LQLLLAHSKAEVAAEAEAVVEAAVPAAVKIIATPFSMLTPLLPRWPLSSSSQWELSSFVSSSQKIQFGYMPVSNRSHC